ncbi:peptide deformylase [Dysgonomonas sp. Marseille-P4677]|uniref:peptide deformylase n=1 Tax=Dysgonomonas sp. Marseille-P4677 TaxID=2364790 RepID=UPI0019137A4A|nr:peptide deformylase [Dysgonomonas sp. Marseille-P4677]MBK5720468.1 peptide deformylase [Dysgonomonas sp. Marseille-P4677]
MTEKEKTLTNNSGIETPFRVLQTTNKEDSIFLRRKSSDINNPSKISKDKDWQHFIQRLKLTLAIESGVGIAAPQVGIGRNLFLFMRIDKPDKSVVVAINPRIVNHSDEIICFEGDGCLSIPDLSGITKRYAWIDVEYYNENGELIKERLSGQSRGGDFTGIIFQHEFDHLQGTLFIDRLCE